MQVEALSHQKERLQLEVDTATTRAANNEKQQQELYDLCNTLQGKGLGPCVHHHHTLFQQVPCAYSNNST
jgi:hypothetical protein